jgi:hypothetical protein
MCKKIKNEPLNMFRNKFIYGGEAKFTPKLITRKPILRPMIEKIIN